MTNHWRINSNQKKLGIHTLDILFAMIINVWSYCTKEWLKFQDNPGKQSHQRNTFSWWKEIQDGFSIKVIQGEPNLVYQSSRTATTAATWQTQPASPKQMQILSRNLGMYQALSKIQAVAFLTSHVRRSPRRAHYWLGRIAQKKPWLLLHWKVYVLKPSVG
jgi:hypothetical protein